MGGTRSTHAGVKEPIKTSVAKPDEIKPRGIRERSCKNNIEFYFKRNRILECGLDLSGSGDVFWERGN